ncbi:zinc ABC transporter ATP-binding protein AztA [Nocardioides hwasunensis]|uniref:ATP-binding cassette domain-containing protein n=1 Tax=Nocardioides hwasunensis TaxID=397258 RepID=A0ABR8MJD1_9ACTN|nr:zinc ABC transporter ATP-binding protein AztA [Nocardioides hwasunensis]MBD3915685.1 ATP-binding cassette domain-containing protein [Nocardioides hwasunensis]
MSPTSTPLAARGLCFAHDREDVLHDVSVALTAGSVTVVAGPNGAGKSTLVELLAGVRRPRAGTVERRGSTALVVQRPAVPDTLPVTVSDVVAMGTWGRRRPRAEVRLAVAEAVQRVGLTGLEHRALAALSGGQRQRALLAQGIVQRADVLLLDEPAAGLDADSRATARRILAAEATERGVAVVCVTHDEEDIAAADHVVRLVGGRRVR